MALREHSRPVTAGRSGRHGRPGPFGGRLRLPTIRFSGAAMAMSTVVGISLATTWLLNEQQQVGRRVGVTVGGPPVPSPDATPTEGATPPAPGATVQAAPATAGGTTTATPAPSRTPGRTPSSGGGTPGGGIRPAEATTAAPPVRPAQVTSAAPTVPGPATGAAPAGAAPSAAPASSPAAPPAPEPHTQPVSLVPGPSAPVPSPSASAALPHTLHGAARTDPVGPTGTRHTLRLDLDEAMTALQVEFRLNRPAALPGTAPATDLPGAVVTIALERDTLVYRFTTPADLPLRPGSYAFTVTGALPTAAPAAPETWTASAFALPTARALTARGAF
ncbi:hypothetical protein HUT16_26030 [Kitasatospora sp. NA04385]|uniref:hypothetical protein n=1 Tax=Kitasatospora sp. NA04385 TaxID=2742135 RepID=UPI001590900E|nr:hypothetical protein [Kitasatospora sp. NA04385]QKW22064.1 hypothetical protein HUT16_26030 [Kitasatospora sp. NA04385]